MATRTKVAVFCIIGALGVACLIAVWAWRSTSGITREPQQFIRTRQWGTGLLDCGAREDCIYVIGNNPGNELWVWEWGHSSPRRVAGLGGATKALPVGRDQYLVVAVGGAIYLKDARTGETDSEWRVPAGWWCHGNGAMSSNGRYVCLRLDEDSRDPRLPSKLRIAVLDLQQKTFREAGELTGTPAAGGTVRSLLCTDDGKYVALAGWGHGAAVLDTSTGKTLWQVRPKHEVCCSYIGFDPVHRILYAGGSEGAVYGFRLETGEIVSCWFASRSGTSEYGHRISSIAVSSDGRYVAAGTGPQGDVYLWQTKSGKRLRLFEHGGTTIAQVAFSPDSRCLASLTAGRIKIWAVPQ